MKAIMISIKPQYVAKILNGEKTIEIRKRFPKDYRGWVYIYGTKEDNLCKSYIRMGFYTNRSSADDIEYNGKGKVVARFYCDNVEETNYDHDLIDEWYATHTLNSCLLGIQSCLTFEEIDDYLKGYGYAIHISQLEIFDKPKELSEFDHYGTITRFHKTKECLTKDNLPYMEGYWTNKLTKAPQNFCYVEVE